MNSKFKEHKFIILIQTKKRISRFYNFQFKFIIPQKSIHSGRNFRRKEIRTMLYSNEVTAECKMKN